MKDKAHRPIQMMLTQGNLTKLIKIFIGILAITSIYSIISTFKYNNVDQSMVDEFKAFFHHEQDEQQYDNDADLNHQEIDQQFLDEMDREITKCPDYVKYSGKKHPPFSPRFNYPYMRPAPKCRTFTSDAVEILINDLKEKAINRDLARLIENCLPNTLDTTILWHKHQQDDSPPESFVVTGDIHAEWLRDAARQLSVYQPLIKHDPKLKELILGAINTQAKYVITAPYCNAFHPPPDSGVKKAGSTKDKVFPKPDWKYVFECKYEIDSLASFLTLTNEYYENSGGDLSFLTDTWLKAYEKVLIVLVRESVPTFDELTGKVMPFHYTFQRETNIGSETLALAGLGNPVNFGTGLIRSMFRPSDDATILQFFIPGNIHMLTELKKIRHNFLNSNLPPELDLSLAIEKTDEFIQSISEGIEKYAIVKHPHYGQVFAYEVDGYGGAIFMDDANIPSLLSMPETGFVSTNDKIYQNTRKMILEKQGNPYYLQGIYFEGIGGPHIGISHAWPMSLLVRIRTSEDDNEIRASLKLLMETTGGLGLMHESVHVNSRGGRDFTRSWFAWCNSEFGKTILYLAKHKPHLIFKEEFAKSAYVIDDLFKKK
ncbi:uncharacterized protein J8A68_001907 [[Candida] subhashii]|uniref:Uncharacterized protein n=1 Tax=[Candida] subhashii TaxID=561895 RepID=A0A8J5UJG9_9ASCO|nr:uncharacterized protein J8A68_001907 [[Candida] subhashii]KAG7664563.1 hypothetical protein J8A68_001907 [[Candida] subhashii]